MVDGSGDGTAVCDQRHPRRADASRHSAGAGEATRFRVGVDAVRIDAVVTDRDGRTVTDLTADDFEVRQDGKLQTVSFVQFNPVLSGPAPAIDTPRANVAKAEPAAAVAPSAVKREDVQRTLAIVVDDLGLSVEGLQSMRGALHKFVDQELRPTDLVALVRTGGAGGGLQPFTTDRRVLHSVIDGLNWNGLSRNGVEPYEALNEWTTFSGGGRGGDTNLADPSDFHALNAIRSSISASGHARRAEPRGPGRARLAGAQGRPLRLRGILSSGQRRDGFSCEGRP